MKSHILEQTVAYLSLHACDHVCVRTSAESKETDGVTLKEQLLYRVRPLREAIRL